MVLTDRSVNGGANEQAIGDAFGAHGVSLGSSAMLAPTVVLAGLLIHGLRLMPALRATESDLRIEVVGERFWWRVIYHRDGAPPVREVLFRYGDEHEVRAFESRCSGTSKAGEWWSAAVRRGRTCPAVRSRPCSTDTGPSSAYQSRIPVARCRGRTSKSSYVGPM